MGTKVTAVKSKADDFAQALRGFGLGGILFFLFILLVGPMWFKGGLVLLWASYAGIPWSELGYRRPNNWLATLLIGLVLGPLFKLLMKAVVMPLLGADPINWTYHYLVGNRAALPGILFLLIVGAGFGEETFFRGYLFERLGKLLGRGPGAMVVIVLLTSALFAVAHLSDQGLAGAEQAFMTGLLFATIFAVTRSLWLPMITHLTFDLAAVAIIYWDIEEKIAHLFFGK